MLCIGKGLKSLLSAVAAVIGAQRYYSPEAAATKAYKKEWCAVILELEWGRDACKE